MIIPQTGVPNLCIPAAAAAMNQHVAGGGWQPGWRETWKTKTYIRFHLFPLNSRIWGNTRNVQFFCPNPYGQKKLSFWFFQVYICYICIKDASHRPKNPRILESAGAFFRHMRHGHGTLYLPERNMEELDQVCGSFFIHSCMILYGPFFLGWINFWLVVWNSCYFSIYWE